jgi:hypothetical protein
VQEGRTHPSQTIRSENTRNKHPPPRIHATVNPPIAPPVWSMQLEQCTMGRKPLCNAATKRISIHCIPKIQGTNIHLLAFMPQSILRLLRRFGPCNWSSARWGGNLSVTLQPSGSRFIVFQTETTDSKQVQVVQPTEIPVCSADLFASG